MYRLRHWLVRVFEMVVRPDESPSRKAAAFSSGVFIGCLPVYGLHLLLSAAAGRFFRFSIVRTYLGAHINNPFTAAPLLYLQVGVGSVLLGEAWPVSVPATFAWSHLASLGTALIVGSLVSGVTLAGLTAVVTLRMARAWEKSPEDTREAEDAARHFLEAGISSWAFARGKLRHDPLYTLLARSAEVASAGSILDLGCGVGLVLARLHQQRIVRSGDSAGWQSAPQSYTGFDASPRRIAVATECLGEWGDFQVVDIARVEFPPVDVIVLADVLHYLPAEDQDEVLQRAARSLRPGGALLLREADAGSGWGFVVTRISERLRALMRGDWRRSFCYRSRKEWASGMTHAGLDVAWQPAGQGTPFANVMLIGKAPPGRGT